MNQISIIIFGSYFLSYCCWKYSKQTWSSKKENMFMHITPQGLVVPADCWIFFRTWSNRSHGKRQSISPVSKFYLIKVIITQKIHVLWYITRVILPFYFSWLFMKSANSFDHIIHDIFRSHDSQSGKAPMSPKHT